MSRTEWIRLRVTPAEKSEILRLGRDFEGGVSELVRRLAAEKAEKRRQEDEEAAEQLSASELEMAAKLGVRAAAYLKAKGEGQG